MASDKSSSFLSSSSRGLSFAASAIYGGKNYPLLLITWAYREDSPLVALEIFYLEFIIYFLRSDQQKILHQIIHRNK
jgi:hypothetical protein